MKKFVFIFSAFMFIVSTMMVITYANFDEEPESEVTSTTTTSSSTTSTTSTTTTLPVEEVENGINEENSGNQSQTSSQTSSSTSSTTKNNTTTKAGTTTQSGTQPPATTSPTTVTTTKAPTTTTTTKAPTTTTTTTKAPTTQPVTPTPEPANPVVSVAYSSVLPTLANEVKVTLTSNKPISSVSGTKWTKVSNYVYTKVFDHTTSTNESVTVTDTDGKKAQKSITISNLVSTTSALGTTINFTNITSQTQTGTCPGECYIKGKLAKTNGNFNSLLVDIESNKPLDESVYSNIKLYVNKKLVNAQSGLRISGGRPIIRVPINMSSNSKTVFIKIDWGNGKYTSEYTYYITVS